MKLALSHEKAEAGSRRPFRQVLVPWLFLLPIIIVNLVVIVGPSAASVFYSFTDWNGISQAHFIGLQNFARMFADPVYWKALLNNIQWTIVFLIVPITMGLLGAALLAPIRRGQMLFRAAYFLPYTFASVVNAQIWRYLLHPRYGIGAWLAEHGVAWANVNVWGNESLVLYSIMFVGNWQWWGYLVVIFLAAMQSVDPELFDAAQLDGANRWQEFRYVTFPGIRPTFVFMVLMTIMWSFLIFDYIYVLTGGGPNHASEVLGTWVYKKAFAGLDAGYAAAMALTMSLISTTVVLGYIKLRRRGWDI